MTSTGQSRVRPLIVNGRCLTREQPTGVDQLPALLAATADDTANLTVIMPTRPGRVVTNLWEQIVLPWRARDGVLLSLANSGPMYARRHVTMIHDMSPWDHPDWFGRAYRWKTSIMNRMWRRSSPLVLAPSQFSADRASAILGIPTDRLFVVGNAHRWSDSAPARAESAEPYVITVSTLSERKNLAVILDAWPLVQQNHPGLRLKVVGASGAPVLSGTGSMRVIDHVDYLGYVDDATLDELMLGAHAAVSASLYEGFNIPLLDALAIGVPVAASRISVHQELYGDAAAFFDPHDADSFAAALTSAIDTGVSPGTRSRYATQFSGAAVAERALDAARRVG